MPDKKKKKGSAIIDDLLGLPPGSRVQRLPTQVYEPRDVQFTPEQKRDDLFDRILPPRKVDPSAPMEMEPLYLDDNPGAAPAPLPPDTRAAMQARLERDQTMHQYGQPSNAQLDPQSFNDLALALERDRAQRAGVTGSVNPMQEIGGAEFSRLNAPSQAPAREEVVRAPDGSLMSKSVLDYLLSRSKGR
jgi:hypothetical protein